MSKITLNNISGLDSLTAATTINNNSSTIQTAMDNTLSRDGTSPNQMLSQLDMNSNQVLNLPAPATTQSPLRLADLNTFIGGGTITSIPAGGTTGQFLTKNSATNYDIGWATSAGGPAAIRMWPKSNQTGATAWNVVDSFGNAVSTAGTTTQGLQEAINYAVLKGFPLFVHGEGPFQVVQQTGTINSSNIITGLTSTVGLLVGDYVTCTSGLPSFTTITSIDSATQIHINTTATATGSRTLTFERGNGANNPTFISCTTGIVFPPIEQWCARFYGVNLTFNSTVTGPCITFDSCMICDVGFQGGQIVGQPGTGSSTSNLILFKPVNPVPLDGLITITGSKFWFSNTAYPCTTGTNNSLFCFDITNGSINNSFFGSQELNGTGSGSSPNTNYGVLIQNAGASTSFEQNIIDISDIHLVKLAGVQVGLNTTNAANYKGNVWRLSGIHPVGVSSDGFNTYGSYDLIEVGQVTNEEGAYHNGFTFQSTAVGNQLRLGRVVSPTNTAYSDGGSQNSLMTTGTLGIGIASPGYAVQINTPSGTHSLLQFTNATTGPTIGAGSYMGVLDGQGDFRIANQMNSGNGILFLVNGTATTACKYTGLGSVVNGGAAVATTATDGFLYITSCAGTPTGVPTAFTGRVPMVYDTTGHKFWIYDSGWKGVVLA